MASLGHNELNINFFYFLVFPTPAEWTPDVTITATQDGNTEISCQLNPKDSLSSDAKYYAVLDFNYDISTFDMTAIEAISVPAGEAATLSRILTTEEIEKINEPVGTHVKRYFAASSLRARHN